MRPPIPPRRTGSWPAPGGHRRARPTAACRTSRANPAPRARPRLSREATTLKNVSRLGKKTAKVSQRVQQLPALVNAGVRVLVMDADRRREDEEQDERGPGHRVAEELASGLARHQHVPRNVRGEQPEVDARMPGEPEECRGPGAHPCRSIRPSDHGTTMKSISAARPEEAMVHITKVTSDMNAGSGVRTSGFRARQARQGEDEIQRDQPGPRRRPA